MRSSSTLTAARKVYDLIHDAAHDRKIISPNKLDGDWVYHIEQTSTFTKVMFVLEGTWRWASWHTNYLGNLGGEDYFFSNVGIAPTPCMKDGLGRPVTLTQPLVYMISSQSMHPDLALLLLSKATVKELNTPYAIESGHLGILKSQSTHDAYMSAKFLSATLSLLEYTTFLPNSPYWSSWSEAFYLGIQAVVACPPKAGPVNMLVLGHRKGGEMARKKHTPEQVINKLREAEAAIAEGRTALSATGRLPLRSSCLPTLFQSLSD